MLTYVKDVNEQKRRIDSLYEVYPLLKILDEKSNGILSQNAVFKTLNTDQYLSNEGEGCMGFIFIVKGLIKIQRMNAGGKETNLYDLKEGQLCNELSNCFKEEDNLNICARALVDSEICVIPCGIAKRYLKQDIKFLRYMYNDLYRKHQIIIRDKESNRHESLEKRLVKLLMSKNSKSIYATHSELAFEIDSTREVISRSLKKIEKQGFIKMLRGKIQILKDLNELL